MCDNKDDRGLVTGRFCECDDSECLDEDTGELCGGESGSCSHSSSVSSQNRTAPWFLQENQWVPCLVKIFVRYLLIATNDTETDPCKYRHMFYMIWPFSSQFVFHVNNK